MKPAALRGLSLVLFLAVAAHPAFAQWQPNDPAQTGTIYYNGGNVGIGVSNPAQKLCVAGGISKPDAWIVRNAIWPDTFELHNPYWDGASNNNYGTIAAGHGYFYGGLQSGGGNGGEAGAGQLFVGGISMLMSNVGVGTATPQVPLHVYQNTAFAETLRLDNPAGGTETGNKLSFHQGINEDGYIDSHYDATNGWAMRFGTRNAGNSAADRMIISNGGKVGIGTMAPMGRLDVRTDTQIPGTGWGTAQLISTDAMAANKGGVLNFGGFYTSAGGVADWAGIAGLKNNATDGDYGGFLTFYTRTNGSATTERMRIGTSGQVSIGGIPAGTQPTDLLVVNGAIRAVSVIGATYQDVAEWVPAAESIAPGTVVIVDAHAVNGVAPSNRPYDTAVAGVISAQPGVLLGREGPDKVKVATTGRVKVRVDASRSPVHPGDLLVSADKPGMAMRSEPVEVAGLKMHRPGTLIGKALEPLESGEGEILVLLSLQ